MSNRRDKDVSAMVMRSFMLGSCLVGLATIATVGACGGKQQPQGGGSGSSEPGVVADTRTPFEKRLAAACKALEPRIVQCTVDDAKAALAAGTLSQKDFTELTKPAILAKLADEWETEKCNRRDRSSRQVRVLEVCFEEETACAPLLDCLTYVDKPSATEGTSDGASGAK